MCFVGDSITTGVGDAGWLGWPIRLCAREGARGRDVTPYNLGVRGDCSEDIRRRWRQECAPRLAPEWPGGIVFAFGINDTCDRGGRRRVSLRRSIANAKSVVASAAAWRPTLWIGPPCVSAARTPWRVTTNGVVHEFRNERIAELSDAFAAIARDLGVPYLDLCRSLAGSAGWEASLARGDGVHPDARGHARLAAIVGGWIGVARARRAAQADRPALAEYKVTDVSGRTDTNLRHFASGQPSAPLKSIASLKRKSSLDLSGRETIALAARVRKCYRD